MHTALARLHSSHLTPLSGAAAFTRQRLPPTDGHCTWSLVLIRDDPATADFSSYHHQHVLPAFHDQGDTFARHSYPALHHFTNIIQRPKLTMSAARTQAIDDAFTNVVAPALVAGGADDSEASGIAGYLASAFAEDVRVALDEPDPDGDAASDGDSAALSSGGEDGSAVGTGTGTGAGAGAGASTPAKRGKLSKAERKAKRDALKKKGGLRAATGEGVFKVQRTRQVGFEKAGELLACTLPDAIADAATGVDVAALQEQLLRSLVVNGAVRDVDDDGFDLVFDEAERKLEAHEVTVDATGLAVLAEDDVWHAVVVTEILEPGQRFRCVARVPFSVMLCLPLLFACRWRVPRCHFTCA